MIRLETKIDIIRFKFSLWYNVIKQTIILFFHQVLDAGGVPIPEPRKYNSSDGDAATTQPHRVLIASEEQFKLFTLPTLKPSGKYKLTAHEGARVRRVGFVTFTQKSNPEYTENCFTCLTNQGDLAIHSLPELRRQVLQVGYLLCFSL